MLVVEKKANETSMIGYTDGPISVFLIKKNSKLTWKQKLKKLRNKIKRNYIAKTLKNESHTLEEVMEYLVNTYGFVELDKDEVEEEYCQMRASFLIQYAPELLGEYTKVTPLKSEAPEDIQAHLLQFQEREQKAQEIPVTEFDIDFHKFRMSFDDRNEDIHIIIEKNYSYIGGGASGNKKTMKQFRRIIKDVYKYYGVTKTDIENKTKRYEDVIRALSR